MDKVNNEWLEKIIVCPDCGGQLIVSNTCIDCAVCNFSDATMRDLRPQRKRTLNIELTHAQRSDPEEVLRSVTTTRPPITYEGPTPIRDSRELMSVISEHLPAPARVLDLGCGPRDQQIPVEHLGHSYIGVDYTSTHANFLADAHALPFRSNSF